MKRFFVFLLLFAFAAGLGRAQRVSRLPEVNPRGIREALPSALDRDSILIGDQINWTFPLEIDKDIRIVLPEMPEQVCEGVEVLGGFGLDTLSLADMKTRLEIRLKLTSFDSGSYALPYMPVYAVREGRRPDTLWFKGPLLYVNTIPVDTTGFVAKDLKRQMRYPLCFADVWPWCCGAVALACLLWLAVYLSRRRKANLPLFGAPKPKDPAHITALRSLDRIKSEQLWQAHKVKLYYTQITDTLRVYMNERWGIQAMEQTSQEMLQSLESVRASEPKLTEERLGDLQGVLYVSDFVKFAKHSPGAEINEETLVKAVRFVTATACEEDKKE